MRRRRRPGSTFTSASGPGPGWRARPVGGVPGQHSGVLGLGGRPSPAAQEAGGIGVLIAQVAADAVVVRPRRRPRRCSTEVGHRCVLANCRCRRRHFPHLFRGSRAAALSRGGGRDAQPPFSVRSPDLSHPFTLESSFYLIHSFSSKSSPPSSRGRRRRRHVPLLSRIAAFPHDIKVHLCLPSSINPDRRGRCPRPPAACVRRPNSRGRGGGDPLTALSCYLDCRGKK